MSQSSDSSTDDDDFIAVAPAPKKRAPETKKARVEPQPNTLEVKSTWITPHSGSSRLERHFLRAQVLTADLEEHPNIHKGTFVTKKSEDLKLEFWCASEKKNMKSDNGVGFKTIWPNKDTGRTCVWTVRFARITTAQHYTLEECDMNHTCDFQTKRKRNVPIGTILQSNIHSVDNIVFPSHRAYHKHDQKAQQLHMQANAEFA